jgi:putative alpha-1,2-mannosidase
VKPRQRVENTGTAELSVWSQKTVAKAIEDYSRDVDPFIGVDWGGNTFVGSTIPFGLVKVGPDTVTFDGRRSGFSYSSNSVILGFSHLHLSGAQGKYGNILVAPVTGPLDLKDIRTPRTDEVAKVGYYAANLTRYQVKAELTSSRRVGFHRYTFPASQQSHVTINVAAALGLGWHPFHQRRTGKTKRTTRGPAWNLDTVRTSATALWNCSLDTGKGLHRQPCGHPR